MREDEQYVVSDTEIDMVLLDIPLDLMKENIRAQINDIHIDVNYMEIISDKIDYLKKLYGDDPETNSKINDLIMDISTYVIAEICERFDFTYSLDLHPDETFELARAMYYCLILNYSKNIRKYLKNYILTHKKEISERYNAKKKDVTTNNVKKKVKAREMVIIISNLPLVVRDIIELSPDVEDFFDALSYHEAEIVNDHFYSMELGGNLSTYFSILTDEYSHIIDYITDDLREKLIK